MTILRPAWTRLLAFIVFYVSEYGGRTLVLVVNPMISTGKSWNIASEGL
jgi:hypothetical protein